MTGKDVMRILRKRKWLILIFLFIFTVISYIGTKIWEKYAPTFTSVALLSVSPPRPDVWAPDARNVAADLDILKESYVRLAKVEAVFRRAINNDVDEQGRRKDRIRRTAYFTGKLSEDINDLKDSISVSSIRDTNLIRIALSGPDKKALPQVVNAIAQSLVTETTLRASARRRTQIKNLTARLNDINNQIAARRKEIKDIQAGSELPLLRERRNIAQISLQSLTTELTALRLLKAQAGAALDALKEQEKTGDLASSPEVLRGLEQDPTYRTVTVNVQNYQVELATLTLSLGEDHRRVKATRGRLESLQKRKTDLEAELVRKQIQAMMQQQQSQVTAVTERLMQVGNQFTEESTSLKDLGTKLAKINELESVIERHQDQATQVQTAMLKLSVVMQEVPMNMQALAEEALEPSMPKVIIMVPLGVFLGLAIGLGLAFLLELIDTSIKSPADISKRVDLPLLGMIPHENDMDEEVDDMRTVVLTNPDSLAGEAYRQVRTCLLFSGPASQRRSLLVTSPSPGDGRTAVTLNLAASIAQGGRKVLVVDANFRQPSVSNLFPQAPKSGLSSALVGQGNWMENVYEADRNLFVMTAGPLPPNPAELLGSEQMRTMIGEMTAQYDQVIFDGAPALVVTDPAVLATLVDGVIIVVRAGANTFGIVQRTRDLFIRVGAHVVGSVLNGVRVAAGGYLKKNYNTFYEYRGEQTGAGEEFAEVQVPKPPLPPE